SGRVLPARVKLFLSASSAAGRRRAPAVGVEVRQLAVRLRDAEDGRRGVEAEREAGGAPADAPAAAAADGAADGQRRQFGVRRRERAAQEVERQRHLARPVRVEEELLAD